MPKKLILLHKVLIICFLATLTSCKDNVHVKDLSNIELDMSVTRFEQALFECNSVDDVAQLATQYPTFYTTYTQSIVAPNVQTPDGNAEDVAVNLYKYIADKDMYRLYEKTQEVFGDFEEQKKGLNNLAKYIQSYFPAEKIENTTTFISTLRYGSAYDAVDKQFLVGLDLYLGSDFEVYSIIDPQNFPVYRVKKFEPYRVVPNCAQTFANYIVKEHPSSNFMEQAIYEGKKLYLMDLLLPKYHDSLKINYLAGQLEWAQEKESDMWTYLIEKEILFSTDKNEYQKHYFNDAPFTTPFQNGSSPRVGAWFGWQIVREYMDKNPSITIQDLIADKNHQAIFQKSGYRP